MIVTQGSWYQVLQHGHCILSVDGSTICPSKDVIQLEIHLLNPDLPPGEVELVGLAVGSVG